MVIPIIINGIEGGLSKIRITNAEEMYNTLKDERQLALVLDEGLDPEHLQYKDQIIEFFTNIRNRISIDDFLKFHGDHGGRGKEKRECSVCESFANIHCVNCQQADKSTWLCVSHWRDHSSHHRQYTLGEEYNIGLIPKEIV
ncbi:MAG: hypothetical protein WBX01_13015 [Nitrososphaeraceae archaeon]